MKDITTHPPSAEVESLRRALVERDVEVARLRRDVRNRDMEIERLDASHAEIRARLAGAEAANAAIPIVEHSELNGHVEIVEQCRDYLMNEVMYGGDPSGKLRDFAESLRIVVDQLDRQRRQRNWYEAAYAAGKQKLIESAVDKALAPGRDAARALGALISDLGAFVDDNDPRAMAIAGPIGKAEADLWLALGMDTVAQAAALQEDITNRCAVCGSVLAASVRDGCVRGNCAWRPRPTVLYAPERAAREAAPQGPHPMTRRISDERIDELLSLRPSIMLNLQSVEELIAMATELRERRAADKTQIGRAAALAQALPPVDEEAERRAAGLMAKRSGTPRKLMPALTADDREALAHTKDDIYRMSTLDDDAGPKVRAVRARSLALLDRLLAGAKP